MPVRNRAARAFMGICAFVVLSFVFVWVARETVLHREPFRMSLTPEGNRTVVRFAQPERELVSPEFPVDLKAEAPRVIDLRSDRDAIPGGTIEFSDTTLLPGRFRIRVGGTTFDVMERGIVVDGREHDWQRP